MIHEKCAVVGIISKNKSQQVAGLIYNSLLALQHRGQESTGISTLKTGGKIFTYKKNGLVAFSCEIVDGTVGLPLLTACFISCKRL